MLEKMLEKTGRVAGMSSCKNEIKKNQKKKIMMQQCPEGTASGGITTKECSLIIYIYSYWYNIQQYFFYVIKIAAIEQLAQKP